VWFVLMAVLAPTALVVGLLDMHTFDRGLAGSAVAAATAVLVSLFARLALIAHASQRRATELALRSTALTEALTRQETLGQELAYRAMHDPLTGLANRAVLVERLDWFLSRAGGTGHPVLLLIDLDGFKDVNDTYGHPIGDELLAAVSQRLLMAVSADAVVARMGGDEFAILFESAATPEAVTKAEQILASIAQPFVFDGQHLCLSASIGVLVCDPLTRPITASRALRDADLALYAAKNEGKNRVVTFTPRLRVEKIKHTPTSTGNRQARSFGEIAA
jgi:diguanylate cyclase (GGDEF)-like protein